MCGSNPGAVALAAPRPDPYNNVSQPCLNVWSL